MGRPHSPGRFQAVVDEWRRQLLVVDWTVVDEGGDARLLAVTIGVDWTIADDAQKARLQAAVAALTGVTAAALRGAARPDALDEWIGRHLVRPRPDLLLSEALRQSALARARDADRRRAHLERGLRSARVEMTDDSWKALAMIRSTIGKAEGAKVTWGKTLEYVIEAYVRGKPPPPTRDRSSRSQEPSLLDGLESERTTTDAEGGA